MVIDKKICSKCKIEKDITDFSWKNKSKGIMHCQCKLCINNKYNFKYAESKGFDIEKFICIECGCSLDGKRIDSKYCDKCAIIVRERQIKEWKKNDKGIEKEKKYRIKYRINLTEEQKEKIREKDRIKYKNLSPEKKKEKYIRDRKNKLRLESQGKKYHKTKETSINIEYIYIHK